MINKMVVVRLSIKITSSSQAEKVTSGAYLLYAYLKLPVVCFS